MEEFSLFLENTLFLGLLNLLVTLLMFMGLNC